LSHSYVVIALGSMIFVMAGVIKGVLGMGLPTFAIGVLSLIIPPAEAAGMLVIPSLLTNIWQLFNGPHFGNLTKRFGLLLIAVCIGTPLGVMFMTSGATHLANIVLGCVLAFYGIFGLSNAKFVVPSESEKLASPVVGLTTGVIMGATGISVMPVGPYFAALGLEKDDLIQALGLTFTVSSLALAIGLLFAGQFHLDVATNSMIALIPAFAGMYLGQSIRGMISQQIFKKCFLGGLVVLGSYMAINTILQH